MFHAKTLQSVSQMRPILEGLQSHAVGLQGSHERHLTDIAEGSCSTNASSTSRNKRKAAPTRGSLKEPNLKYELYDPFTVMFFFRNKHIMIDLSTGNNNKINWPLEDKHDMIEIVETVYRGARKCGVSNENLVYMCILLCIRRVGWDWVGLGGGYFHLSPQCLPNLFSCCLPQKSLPLCFAYMQQ
ncbi:hypothetical protein DMENIID0001_002250 [Sergentomyia squamirostris]